jgi:agmatine deiminase
METKTPAELGYHMPVEWEPRKGTWLIWPHNDTQEGTQLRLEHLWLTMTIVLHEHGAVHIVVTDERCLEHLQRHIRNYGLNDSYLDIHIIPNDDVWVRDCGPIFLVSESCELSITAWDFNGWGKRYPFQEDPLVPTRVAEAQSLPLFNAPITLEGGGLEVNGKGALLATRNSIINPNRNPGKNQEEIEATIKEYLGIQHFICLSGAPREFFDTIGGETDLNIDGYARFGDESTVLYFWTEDESNIFHPYLKRHRDELRDAKTESGKPLTLIPLPKPENEMYSTLISSTRLPFYSFLSLASYENFYFTNNVVPVPVYGDIHDARAKEIISEHFPNREIIGIPAWATAEHGGMMHCVTQKQPQPLGKVEK